MRPLMRIITAILFCLLMAVMVGSAQSERELILSEYPSAIARIGFGDSVYVDTQEDGGSYLHLVRSNLKPAFIIGGTSDIRTKIGETVDIIISLRGTPIDGQSSHTHKLTVYQEVDGQEKVVLPTTDVTVGFSENKDVTLKLKIPDDAKGTFKYIVKEVVILRMNDKDTETRGDKRYINIEISETAAPTAVVEAISEEMKAAAGSNESSALGKKIYVTLPTPKPTPQEVIKPEPTPIIKTEPTVSPPVRGFTNFVTGLFSGDGAKFITPVEQTEKTQPEFVNVEFANPVVADSQGIGKLELANNGDIVDVYVTLLGKEDDTKSRVEVDIRRKGAGRDDRDSKYELTLPFITTVYNFEKKTEKVGVFRFKENPMLKNAWGKFILDWTWGGGEPYEYYVSEVRMDEKLVYRSADSDERTRVVLKR